MKTINTTRIDLNLLVVFEAIYTEGSVTRASSRLNLTQPAISDHVKKLEETHGVQLFVRGARAIEMTEMGRKLFAIVERQFEAEAEALDLLSKARTLEEGQLTIGADAAIHVLPQVARFRTRYPAIGLKLVTGNSAELLSRLENFAIDLAVTAERPANDAILARLLRRDRLVAVAAGDGPRRLSLEKLVGLPLILREEGSMTRRLLLDELRRRNLRPLVSLDIESREAAREAVAQGLGVAIMSEGELVLDARIRVVTISDWQAEMEEWLLCLKARAGLHVIRSFFEEVTFAKMKT